jgi:MFS family permease
MALYYQDGLGFTAFQSGLGITAFAIGSAVAAPLAGRVVTRLGRPLVVGAAATFGVGTVALGLVAGLASGPLAPFWLAGPLLVMGLGSGALITPNQTLTLMDVDPVAGSTAGGVLQTSQRIGLAIGQSVIGAVFFAALPQNVSGLAGSARGDAFGHAVGQAVLATLGFVALALLVGLVDLRRNGRHAVDA